MTHIAIAQALNGKVVDWMEHVLDAKLTRMSASDQEQTS
jgi:hypothetical protein